MLHVAGPADLVHELERRRAVEAAAAAGGMHVQTLTADYIHEGATGCSGHVAEPYLFATPRPDLVLPAYFSGRNLAESFYLGIRGLSWQNIVIGDPLCRLGKPAK